MDAGDGRPVEHVVVHPWSKTVGDIVADLDALRPRGAPRGAAWYFGAQPLRRDDTTRIADRFFNDRGLIAFRASPDEASFTDERGTTWRAGPHLSLIHI